MAQPKNDGFGKLVKLDCASAFSWASRWGLRHFYLFGGGRGDVSPITKIQVNQLTWILYYHLPPFPISTTCIQNGNFLKPADRTNCWWKGRFPAGISLLIFMKTDRNAVKESKKEIQIMASLDEFVPTAHRSESPVQLPQLV